MIAPFQAEEEGNRLRDPSHEESIAVTEVRAMQQSSMSIVILIY